MVLCGCICDLYVGFMWVLCGYYEVFVVLEVVHVEEDLEITDYA